MQQEDDLRALEKIVQFARAVSVVFLVLNVYWFGYEWFSKQGFVHPVTDRILENFQRTTALFSYSTITKLYCLLFLALSCYGTKSVRDTKISHSQIGAFATIGFALLFFNDFLRFLPIGINAQF